MRITRTIFSVITFLCLVAHSGASLVPNGSGGIFSVTFQQISQNRLVSNNFHSGSANVTAVFAKREFEKQVILFLTLASNQTAPHAIDTLWRFKRDIGDIQAKGFTEITFSDAEYILAAEPFLRVCSKVIFSEEDGSIGTRISCGTSTTAFDK